MNKHIIQLVMLDDNYISYLFNIDNHVMYNKNHRRPYIGVLFEVKGQSYYAPLSSPKEKFFTMKNDIDFMRIDGGKLGAICFNNMIPTVKSAIYPINIAKTRNQQYKFLLLKQIEFFNDNEIAILHKATNLYKLYKQHRLPVRIKKRIVDFGKLEVAANQYKNKNNKKAPRI